MVELGYNYRLTDIGAALGSSQLDAARRVPRPAARARGPLPGAAGRPPSARAAGRRAGRGPRLALLFVQLRLDRLTRRPRRRLPRAAGRGDRGQRPLHPGPPASLLPRSGIPGLSFPVAEAAYERLLTLPLHAGMTDADVDDVVAALDKVTAAYVQPPLGAVIRRRPTRCRTRRKRRSARSRPSRAGRTSGAPRSRRERVGTG